MPTKFAQRQAKAEQYWNSEWKTFGLFQNGHELNWQQMMSKTHSFEWSRNSDSTTTTSIKTTKSGRTPTPTPTPPRTIPWTTSVRPTTSSTNFHPDSGVPGGVAAAATVGALAGTVMVVAGILGCLMTWKRIRPSFRRKSRPSLRVRIRPSRNLRQQTAIKSEALTVAASRDVFNSIPLSDFHLRVEEMHKDQDSLFQSEFERLDEQSRNLPADRTTLTAMKDFNIRKNRFIDILPFEDTMVKIRSDSAEEEYINASYIAGHNLPREYIATQGPLGSEDFFQRRNSTIETFWKMIWAENVSTVVMLCQCMELSRRKCAMYWPLHVNDVINHGDKRITLKSQTEKVDFTVREMLVERRQKADSNTDSRLIRQWHFPNWPDMRQTPKESLLRFILELRQSGAFATPPTLVHCSAGVGRTGTLIALDCLLQHIRQHDKVNVFGCVLSLRKQRIRMVQSLEQYILLYDALDFAIQQKLHARSSDHIIQTPEHEMECEIV